MRINDVQPGLNSYQNQINRNKTKTTNSSKIDVVEISTNGKEIYEAMKADQADQLKRIEQLKEQISAGTYKVDSQKLAQTMLDYWNK